ncbi:MAG: GNAT family N-acetyltransferase [Ferruginibacter sp.]
MMIQILRTNSSNTDFHTLVNELDKELKYRDGDDHAFYAQFNKTVTLNEVVVAYENNIPVGSGALRSYDENTMEIKRMFVPFEHRKKGIATNLLIELLNWSKELQYKKCILETGKNQPEAIALYLKNGFTIIPNYGNYTAVYNSVCFEYIL